TSPSSSGRGSGRGGRDAAAVHRRGAGARRPARHAGARGEGVAEMTAGYAEDPAEILARTFDESSDELVILRGISFYSTCEHHLLPFYGQAVVGYLPGKVVGISKLARLVECFAKRLQVQERMTRQIAEAVETHLEARGVGVV